MNNNSNTITASECGHFVGKVFVLAGLIARRIFCCVKAGKWLDAVQRCGSIRFGSRFDVFMPIITTRCMVVGDKVSGIETILAKF